MFSRVLVANRGEIALRILSSLKNHDVETVILSSPIDENSLPVRYAHQVIKFKDSIPAKSYLNQELIIDRAKDMGIDAIHPGYGFLAENVEFRKRVEKSGIAFIGPTVNQMQVLGDKIQARKTAIETNTPLLPGTTSGLSVEELQQKAKEIGYPILIKAAAGGGGRGIRHVQSPEDFETQATIAQQEARMAFGDDRIYIEKYLNNARHVEVQLLGKGDGEVLHFGERDCSMQRKNQKLIEESPAPTISRKTASKIQQTAIDLATHLQYANAGTAEFMVANNKDFYFLEVNTRIQVEHPVSEYVTGEDLIWRQIQIAAGDDINLQQKDITFRGHAIEARIYAENPYNNFMPSPGIARRVVHPFGAGIRVDSYIETNTEIPSFYDSLVSKLIVHSTDRPAAVNKLYNALDSYKITGIQTTLPFIKQIIRHPDFQQMNYSTKYLDTHMDNFPFPEEYKEYARAIATIFHHFKGNQEQKITVQATNHWKRSLFPVPRWK